MTEMLRLIKANNIRAEDVRHVRVGTNSNMPNALIHHRPKDELQAKFSMEFCMAILLLDRRAGLNEFTDDTVEREDVKAMIEKVDFVVDADAEAAGYHLMTTIIDIELADGRKISGRADFGRGSPAFPMSYDEVADKFRENAEFARMGRQRADEIVELVRALEELTSLDELTRRLIAVA
jgi:2-methylcitrate dehydratase PrpD